MATLAHPVARWRHLDIEVEARDAKGRIALPSKLVDRSAQKEIERRSSSPDKSLVLVGRDGRRRVVLSADRAAMAAGLRMGIPAAKAQALTPGLVLMDADPQADVGALDRLAMWALRRYGRIQREGDFVHLVAHRLSDLSADLAKG